MTYAHPTSTTERPPHEMQLFLREYSHRINNEFTCAISTVSLAEARCAGDEAKFALARVREQLFNYALVHHALRIPERTVHVDAAAYMRQLCKAIVRSKLADKRIKLLLVEYPVEMASECCWRLGLIVSELITNLTRHAFGDGGGVIRVELRPVGSSLQCQVSDNGRCDQCMPSPGEGCRIIDALVRGLGGTIDQQFGPQGSCSTIIVPLDH